MTKNLYRVVDTKTRKVIQEGFASKLEAKVVRNKHNGESNSTAEGGAMPRYVVSRGTDHPNGSTDGIDHSTRR